MAEPILVSVRSCDGKRATGECDGQLFAAFWDHAQKWRVENISEFSFGQRVAIAKAIRKYRSGNKEAQNTENVESIV